MANRRKLSVVELDFLSANRGLPLAELAGKLSVSEARVEEELQKLPPLPAPVVTPAFDASKGVVSYTREQSMRDDVPGQAAPEGLNKAYLEKNKADVFTWNPKF